ncbi:exo-alpha-sialidase [Saccharomonospora piscinae]|uniref:exo-alpha-sialidase n=1 Tax=Saccharomonospora piscinae TaxID=687388 RepID=UPI00207BBF32|nr:exo-alpha-sialidase [Saccharomonospora piscinae]
MPAGHLAFPSVAQLDDGRLLLVWRRGSDHYLARDGVIEAATSADLGVTWSPPCTVLTDTADLRDPCVANLDGVLYLTYFKGTSSSRADGAYVRRSDDQGATWGPEYRIDPGGYAAICAPLVALPDGRLLAVYYGRQAGETFDSVWAATSSDGQTWDSTRLVGGDARSYQEPWAVRSGDEITVTYRWGGSDGIGGIQGDGDTWDTPERLFTGTGRPSACWDGDRLVIVYRGPGGHTVARWLHEGTVSAPRTIHRAEPGGMMTYAHPLMVEGWLFCPLSTEDAQGETSELRLTYLSTGGHTPLGWVPSGTLAVLTDYDTTLAATVFDQPDGTPRGWRDLRGSTTVRDGLLASTTHGAADVAVLPTGAADVTITADLRWTGQSGTGITLRAIDSQNYLWFVAELDGTVLRLYKREDGTVTKLAGVWGDTAEGVWHHYRVDIRGPLVRCYLDGELVIDHTLADTDQATFGQAHLHGVALNAPDGGEHQCRRITIHN